MFLLAVFWWRNLDRCSNPWILLVVNRKYGMHHHTFFETCWLYFATSTSNPIDYNNIIIHYLNMHVSTVILNHPCLIFKPLLTDQPSLIYPLVYVLPWTESRTPAHLLVWAIIYKWNVLLKRVFLNFCSLTYYSDSKTNNHYKLACNIQV